MAEGEEKTETVKEKDVYDTMLTQGEIQEGVNDVNTAVKKQEAKEKCESSLLPPLPPPVLPPPSLFPLSLLPLPPPPSFSPLLSTLFSSALCCTVSERGHQIWWQDGSTEEPAVIRCQVLQREPTEHSVVC